jgi:hypothetical protein
LTLNGKQVADRTKLFQRQSLSYLAKVEANRMPISDFVYFCARADRLQVFGRHRQQRPAEKPVAGCIDPIWADGIHPDKNN